MTRAEAIRRHCLDCCAGDSRLDVTLCVTFHCPLWPFRTGFSPGTAAYKSRLKLALDRRGGELDAEDYAYFMASLKSPSSKKALLAGKRRRGIPKARVGGDKPAKRDTERF